MTCIAYNNIPSGISLSGVGDGIVYADLATTHNMHCIIFTENKTKYLFIVMLESKSKFLEGNGEIT